MPWNEIILHFLGVSDVQYAPMRFQPPRANLILLSRSSFMLRLCDSSGPRYLAVSCTLPGTIGSLRIRCMACCEVRTSSTEPGHNDLLLHVLAKASLGKLLVECLVRLLYLFDYASERVLSASLHVSFSDDMLSS